MLTFLIVVVIAGLASWGIETYCKMGNADPTRPNEFTQDWQAIKNEVTGIKQGVTSLGWNILWPLTPLIGLVCLVWWALSRSH
jgi:hypothetical protein